MKGRSCPDLTASFGDDFGQFGGIFLSCQMIWTDLACLLSLPTWFLSIFTHKSIWHLFVAIKSDVKRLLATLNVTSPKLALNSVGEIKLDECSLRSSSPFLY